MKKILLISIFSSFSLYACKNSQLQTITQDNTPASNAREDMRRIEGLNTHNNNGTPPSVSKVLDNSQYSTEEARKKDKAPKMY